MIIFLNGDFLHAKDAKVSIFDQGLLRGDGLFETLRSRDGKIHFVAEHIERISNGALQADMTVPYSANEIEKALYALLEKNNLSEAKLRILMTRGAGETMDISEQPKRPTFLMMAEGIEKNPYKIDYTLGVRTITVPIFIHNGLFPQSIKTTSYFHNMYAKRLAKTQGAFEAILVDQHGRVVEGSTSNLFWVRDNQFFTPPLALGPLPGITRKTISRILQQEHRPLIEESISEGDLLAQDEIFICGSVTEIVGVHQVNKSKIGERTGPNTLWIAEQFQKFIRCM